MIENGQRLKPGDILRNDWAGEDNPQKYTMYLKRGKAGNQKTIDCLAYDGRILCKTKRLIDRLRLRIVKRHYKIKNGW